MYIELISTFLQISGLVIGLGAVIVIDFHGLLAQNSLYWTKATISAHKVTKPLIWVGTFIYSFGLLLSYNSFTQNDIYRVLLLIPMVLNGVFLSFYVSPFLLKMETENNIKLLPKSLKLKIRVSLIFSDLAWWLSVFLLVYGLVN